MKIRLSGRQYAWLIASALLPSNINFAKAGEALACDASATIDQSCGRQYPEAVRIAQNARAQNADAAELSRYLTRHPVRFIWRLRSFVKEGGLGDDNFGANAKVTKIRSHSVENKTENGYLVTVEYVIKNKYGTPSTRRDQFLVEHDVDGIYFITLAKTNPEPVVTQSVSAPQAGTAAKKKAETKDSIGPVQTQTAMAVAPVPPVVSRAEAEAYFSEHINTLKARLSNYNRSNGLASGEALSPWDGRTYNLELISKFSIQRIEGDNIFTRITYKAGLKNPETVTYVFILKWRNGDPIFVDHLDRASRLRTAHLLPNSSSSQNAAKTSQSSRSIEGTNSTASKSVAVNMRIGAELENYISKHPGEFKSKLSAFAQEHDLGETEIGWHPKVTEVVSYEVQDKTNTGYVVAIEFLMQTTFMSGTLNKWFVIEFNNNRLRFIDFAPSRS